MADYNDYLAYLHHVDDTTLQEFKKKEDELRHQIDVVRDQCQKDIRKIKEIAAEEMAQLEEGHKAAMTSLNAQCLSSVEKIKAEKAQLKASHKAELARLNAEKDAAVEKLSTAMAQIEEEKKSAVEQALAKIKSEHERNVGTLRNQYQSSIDKLNAEIKQLKDSQKREMQRIADEKDAQILDLTNKLAKIEAEKFSFRKIMNEITVFILSLFMSAKTNLNNTIEELRLKFKEKVRQKEEERRRQQKEECKLKEVDAATLKEENNVAIDVDRSFCRVCGNPLKPGAFFCNKCGAKL